MKKLLLAIMFLFVAPGFVMALAVPTATVTSPNGGESFKVGDTIHITWSSANTATSSINIGYSYCAGCLEWIANYIPNTGSYDWTVPVLNTTNTQYKIFVVPAVTGSTISDYSDNYFTIAGAPPAPSIQPTVTVTSPNGGEAFNVGDNVHITWNSTNATRASIGYSTCSSCGATIVNDIPNTGSYDWVANVVAGAGSTAKTWVKIYVSVGTPGVGTAQDYSDSDFSVGVVTTPAPTPITVTTTPIITNTTSTTITPSASIVSPSTNDVWLPGNTYSIKWNQQNISNIGRIALMHSGSEATHIFVTNLVTTLDPQTKEISFTVPSDLILKTDSSRWPSVPILESNLYTIEIIGGKDSQKSFYSGTFAIKKPSTIFHSASSSGIPTPYLLDIDSITDTSITPRLGVTPNGTENARVRFKIELKNGTSVFKTAIVPLPPVNTMYSASTTITGLSPSTDYVLTTQAETDQVVVYPQFRQIVNFTTKPASSAPQTTSSVSTGCTAGAVWSSVTGQLCPATNTTATVATPAILVLSPGSSENLGIGKTHTIRWTSSNLISQTVAINLHNSAGNYIKNIVQNIPNSGSYVWTVDSSMLSGGYKILVATYGDPPEAMDYSDIFKVYNSQSVTLTTTPTSPTGCTSTVGYSIITGKPCATMNTVATPTPAIVGGVDTDPSGTQSCTDLTVNMRYRMRDSQANNEISELQDFLNAEGYLASQPTGFFGLATFAAVKKFQSASGYSPTGYVGPLTRAKIKAKTCSATE